MNYENFTTTLAHIERHLEQFNQQCPFETDAACCFFANARRIFGEMDRVDTTRRAGARIFGLEPWSDESSWLFDHRRTLDDFRRVRHVLATARLAQLAQS